MKRHILSQLLTLALGSTAVSAYATDYLIRVPAPAKCPATGCVLPTTPGSGGNTTPPPPVTVPVLVIENGAEGGVDFGAIEVGSTSSTHSLTLRNAGNAPLLFSSLDVATGRSDFGQSNDCGSGVAPGSACTVNLAFTPAAEGVRGGTLSLATNARETLIPLSGSGLQARLVVTGSPASAQALPSSLVGVTAAQTVTLAVTNQGSLTGGISPVMAGANASDFPMTSTCATVPAGASCAVTVAFKPTAWGARSASMELLGTTFTFTGTGSSAVATLDSGNLTYGDVVMGTASPSKTLVFRNTGNYPMTLSGLTGLPSQATLSGSCSNVAPNSTCSFSVSLNTSTAVTLNATATTAGSNVIQASLPLTAVVKAPASCAAILAAAPGSASGTYTIDPDGAGPTAPFSAYCDMTTDGGGWTRVSSINKSGSGVLATDVVDDKGLTYSQVLLYAGASMTTAYNNTAPSVWTSTGINYATQGVRFGSSWYFAATAGAWRGYGSSQSSPFALTLSGAVAYANANYSVVVANSGGSCLLNGITVALCGRAVKVAVPTGTRITGFNDLESLAAQATDNTLTRALDIYVR